MNKNDLSSLIPIFTIIILVWIIITFKSSDALILLFACSASEILGNFLKIVIRQPRPISFGCGYKGYGMPSTCSLFAATVASYLFLYLIIVFGSKQALLLAGAVVAAAILIAIDRVYLCYHTPAQVVVGLILGTILGSSAFIVASKFNSV